MKPETTEDILELLDGAIVAAVLGAALESRLDRASSAMLIRVF